MGWKNVRDHYQIGHIVQVIPEKGICIGSGYIHDIIVIGFDGSFAKKYEDNGFWSRDEDLSRYQSEMLADMPKLAELVKTPDTFDKFVTIYTYSGSDILEKQCEIPEWPNVTHDGCLIFENTFSTDRNQVIEWARANAKAYLSLATDSVQEARQRLDRCLARQTEAKQQVETLKSIV